MDSRRTNLLAGIMLVGFGLLILIGQVAGLGGWGNSWPYIVIGFGVLFFVGMVLGGKQSGALAIPGSILAGIGLMLLVQNLFNLWETWSYAWGLIIFFVGVGLFTFGLWSDRPDLRHSGARLVQLGLLLFLIFGAIFEFIFSYSGLGTHRGGLVWATILVLTGLFLLVIRMVRLLQPSRAEGISRSTNLFWPLILVGLGLLWLLVGTNVVAMDQAAALLNLWPVLLIAAGLNVIFGSRWPWFRLVTGLAVVVALLYFALYGQGLGLPARFTWFVPGINLFGGKGVVGSGNMATETRPVSGFDRLELSGIGDAQVVQGETESLEIEAEDNLLPYITSQVVAGQLTIGVQRGISIRPTRPILYKLTVKSLHQVTTSGIGKISIDSLVTDQLKTDSSGTGNIEIGKLRADGLEVHISGLGSIHVSGSVNQLILHISGAGSLKGEELKTSQARADISGTGSAMLWVTDTLTANISGLGSISYYGNPVVRKEVSGVGTLHSLGEK